MSEIKFVCPHCQQSLKAPSGQSGSQGKCPRCSKILTVPDTCPLPPSIPKKDASSDANDLREQARKQAEAKSDSFGERLVNMEEDESDYAKLTKEAFAEFKRFDYSLLKPMLRIFSPRLLKRRAVRWVAGFGFFPLLVLYLSDLFEWRFKDITWFLGAYFCFFWIVYFNSLLMPSKEVRRQGMKWAFFTMIIGIPVLLAWKQLPLIRNLYSGTQSPTFLFRTFAFIVGVGVCEEVCKALPLLVFGRGKPKLLTPHNAIYLGIMSGLGFALAEVVDYSIRYWQTSAQVSAAIITKCMNQPNFEDSFQVAVPILVNYYGKTFVVQVVRFMSLPLLHATWAGVVGYFIGLSLFRKKAQWVFIAVGIAAMAILHGLYDVFSNGLLGLVFAVVSCLTLMSYLSEENTITEKVRIAEAQSK